MFCKFYVKSRFVSTPHLNVSSIIIKRNRYGMELGIDHKTVLNHLHKAGYKKKLDVWVPHELSAKNMIDRINICDALLKRNEIEPFLKRVITGDEKWITYDNRKRQRSWIRDDVVFHHDNARPHTSLMTRQKLRELGLEVLMHPPYSPDIAPSDYHLFRSLQNFLNGIKLLSKKPVKQLDSVFQPEITEVLHRWHHGSTRKMANIVDNNGTYLV
ncbi:histone-lysine N-methyltransferase SETMAR-like [Nylanderia fulva]|uniref:histone-lysine N-methyltransferase SETMAR-like n=1 Tax=Nylanderia fulva TaxID=613905 RepID=UPI0010FB187F|nr:histone-lysine N-methyltransferase SETMAR-like [Nylanderia fulva]